MSAGLSIEFAQRRRPPLRVVDQVDVARPAGHGRRHRRRVGLRQDDDRQRHHAPPAAWRSRSSQAPSTLRDIAARSAGRRDAAYARQAHRHDLPESDDLAQSGLHHRPPDERHDDAPRADQPRRRYAAGRRSAAQRRHPGGRAPVASLPPSALRRHAAARHHRHGPLLPARPADRRRADHRPGRDHSGPDPGAPRSDRGRSRSRHPLHLARLRRHRPHVR